MTVTYSPTDAATLGRAGESELGQLLLRWYPADKIKPFPKGEFGPDFGAEDDAGNVLYYDAHCRGNWEDGTRPFPYRTVHVPERYRRHAEQYGDAYRWVTISQDRRGYGIAFGPVILDVAAKYGLVRQGGRRGDDEYVDMFKDKFEWGIGDTPTADKLQPRLL